jgi:hypothetical protein
VISPAPLVMLKLQGTRSLSLVAVVIVDIGSNVVDVAELVIVDGVVVFIVFCISVVVVVFIDNDVVAVVGTVIVVVTAVREVVDDIKPGVVIVIVAVAAVVVLGHPLQSSCADSSRLSTL